MTADTFKPGLDDEPRDRTATGLLKDLVRQISALFRQEIALAKAEVSENVSKVGSSIAMIVVGAVLGIAALVVLLFAAVYGLAEVMDLWLAALIVGVVAAVIAGALAMAGKNRLAPKNLVPNRTLRTLRDDAEFVREKVQ